MNTDTTTASPLQAGLAAMQAFFREGEPALRRALDAFQAAEAGVRASTDSATLTLWLLGTATALRYTRRPEPMEAGLQRARELVNAAARAQGEAATIPYRALVESLYRDLADVVPAGARESLAAGLEYSERTVRMARRARRDDWLAAALSSRADLLSRAAGDERRVLRRAVTLYEEARRRWPARDAEGRARVGIGYAAALLASGQAGKAEITARESLTVLTARDDRYHEAAARLVHARALYALGLDEALDEQAAAAGAYRMLGCRWEIKQAEGALR
jgi:hypothetical protein